MNNQNILDQSTDTDFKAMHQILQKVASAPLLTALESLSIDYDGMDKLSSDRFADQDQSLFPVDTAENTILSKLYFDHQRDQFHEKVANDISARLDAFLDIHGLPSEIFKYKDLEKVANAQECFTLLPEQDLCKVASEEDLNSAGGLFTRDGMNLTVPERVSFAQNFVKAASHFNVTKYPVLVAKYASQLDTDLENTKYLVEARALLSSRTGQDGSDYEKLAADIGTVTETPETAELTKLAEVLHTLDVSKGFDSPRFDKQIPCAYSSVFNKMAEESSKDTDKDDDELKKMDKASVVGKYGEGALEQVEGDDGKIDHEKLKEVAKLKQAFQPEQEMKDV